ncbi:hypothetical protein [Corynebacterium casei]|uniref:hypothetical protein n=1 Tax=Corynebacterium casei TaxID=160386 RepID=UPI002649E70E|nr:hypothetical protein [Corynebacterium casei]MDN6263065.1 hypothetical protein [Corynebacterium casei]
MARHSNGKDNYKVAGWVIAVAIAVVVAIIALIIFLLSRGGDDVDNAADSAITSEAPAETQEDDAATDRTYEEVTSEENKAEATSRRLRLPRLRLRLKSPLRLPPPLLTL